MCDLLIITGIFYSFNIIILILFIFNKKKNYFVKKVRKPKKEQNIELLEINYDNIILSEISEINDKL